VFNVVDELSKKILFIYVADSIRSQQLIEMLMKLIDKHDWTMMLRGKNGPAFVSLDLLKRCTSVNVNNLLI